MEATENTPLPSNDEPKHNRFPATCAGGLISASVLSIPIGVVVFFVVYCNSTGGEFDLDSSVEVTSALKVQSHPTASTLSHHATPRHVTCNATRNARLR